MTQQLRHAWRSLLRTPVFTITATLTLVIGMGAVIAIFAVVNGVLLRPLPYSRPDRLVGAWFDLPPINLFHTQQTAATYFTFKRLARTIEGIGVYQDGSVNVALPGGDAQPQRLANAWISTDVISTLGVQPQHGRNFNAAEDLPKGPNAVIISDAFWRQHFAAHPKAIGKTLDVNGLSREIIGVMPPSFRFPASETQLWLPLALDPNDPFPGGFNYNSVARLKAGVSPVDAQREFAALLPRMLELFPNVAPGVSTKLLLDQAKPKPVIIPLKQDMTSDIARTLWMVGAAAMLVLLVACFNVANLILVRADARQRELAVREALGAGRARVLAHFLGESALLAIGAGVVATVLAWVSVRALVASAPVEIPRLAEVGIDGTVLLVAAALIALVAVICSAIPALRIGRIALASALREGGRSGTAGKVRQRVRGALVAAQIALALVVLAGSALLIRTFQRLNNVRPGFDADHVATFWVALPRTRYAGDTSIVNFYSQLLARTATLPGVQAVGLSAHLPLETHGQNSNPFYPEGDATWASKIPPLQVYVSVDSGYFGAMRIPLIAGRNFDHMLRQHDDEMIISQATAERFWHDPTGKAAIGKRVRELPNAGPWRTVIGVVGSVRDSALAAPPAMTVYVPEAYAGDTAWRGFSHLERTMGLVVRTAGDPASITSAVQRVVHDLDATLPTFDVRPMSAVLRSSTARLSFIMLLLGSAAVVTLLLGAIGLYGVMAYVVTLRTKELGVRVALGAAPSAVTAMLTRQGLMLTVIGVGVGLALFAVVARFLRAFLYDTAPSDPVALIGASLVLLVVATLASVVPAIRAARVDPVEALRSE